ncbi:MAG: hypothetical protein J0G37_06470 [Afipia sp.]|jgi:hypothetical protein|nr:hypothetical protein [Afipia sp.]
MMQSPTGTAMSGWIRRTVERGVPAAAAVTGHIAILLALAFVGPGDVIISELPAAIAVEIVLAPPSNAAASLAVPETVLDAVAVTPSEAREDEVVDDPEQREPHSAPVTAAAPNIIPPAPPKRTAAKTTAARSAPPAKRPALPVAAPIVASTGASDGPAGGSTGSVGTSVSPADVPSI